jgi:membrane-associated phospholipid phosphatase
MSRIKGSWINFWKIPDQRYEFIFATVVLTVVMLGSVPFLLHIEARSGVQLHDPLFNYLPARDLSDLIFYILYTALLLGVVFLLPSPERLMIAFEAYALFVILRMITMTLVPLEPPNGLIPLVDPILSFMYTGKQVNKDLFFSGHTATMYLLYLMLPDGIYRKLAFVGVIVMGICLLFQRVHYTVDVIVAPFFAYGALRIVLHLRRTLGLKDSVFAAEE